MTLIFSYLILVFLTSIIHIVGGEITETDQNINCTTEPVAEGDTGSMEFTFSHHLILSAKELHFYIRKGDGPNLLVCDADKGESSLNCETKDNTLNFTSDGLKSNTLTVTVPNVKRELDGEYVFGGFVNGNAVPKTHCKFPVLKETAGTFTAEKKSDVVKIAVPVVVVALLVLASVVIIAILIVRRRTRNYQQPTTFDEPTNMTVLK